MYGKFFASTFTGSMMAAGAEVFAVWGYVIAHAVESRVELNARLLAAVIGSTPDRIEAAIDALCAPDPHSRNPESEGRRLIREGQYQYYVTGHEKYRQMRNEGARREYNRLAKQKSRAKSHPDAACQTKSNGLSNGQPKSAEMSAYTDTEAKEEISGACAPSPPAGAFPGFAKFWELWPRNKRKGGKSACLGVWKSRHLEAVAPAILAHVEAMSHTDEWRKQSGEFIPAPVGYLRRRQWDGADLSAIATPENDIFSLAV